MSTSHSAVQLVDVDAAKAPAFGLSDEFLPLTSDFHVHNRHQLLYAASGLLYLTVGASDWVLPPHRAAFLSAGTLHQVRCEQPVALRTVYLDPSIVAAPPWDCRVFTVSPLAKELLLYAMRWNHQSDPDDPLLHSYFSTLGQLALEWSEQGALPFRLPVPPSDELRRVTRLIRDRLDESLSVADLAKAAALSERTLRRRFASELGMTPHAYLHAERMLAALDRLTNPSLSITEVALAVGFETPSSFSHAFTAFVGESPRDYRQKLRYHHKS
ncbi:MAG: helix-turn-helix transcriptional regulator [Myxococcales bacterium]|nr:helix-turn-helix transcriptional regulator [Myxococcales bacterium]